MHSVALDTTCIQVFSQAFVDHKGVSSLPTCLESFYKLAREYQKRRHDGLIQKVG